MRNTDTIPQAEETAIPYPSFASLKETHIQLLKYHHNGDTEKVLNEIEIFVQRGTATGALLDAAEDRWASQSLLDYWVTVLYRSERTPPDSILAEFDPSLAPKLDDALSPYIGLGAFQEEDKDKYFGRESLIENMVSQIEHQRLLAVIGPSGSGKSSLILAGLMPALKNGALTGSENWKYFPRMVPGSNPLRNLARAIRQDTSSAEWVQQQAQGFKQDPYHLLRLITGFGNAPAVIVIDQFEEVFTLCTDENVRNSFIENLVHLVEAPGQRHTVILTMRTEFETQIARHDALMSLYIKGQARVTPLGATDLHQAIEEPAKRIGLRFEDGIIEELVRDILGEPAGLPLLQFTLHRLWKDRESNRVTWRAYKNLGGARQALARTADEFYQKLMFEDQQTAKRILLKLARPSDELMITSNRVKRKTLYTAGEGKDQVDHVLEKLINAGLVRLTPGETHDDDRVEVAHEALIRNWPELAKWLEEERAELRQRLRLTAFAEQWLEHDKDNGGLLGGSLLEEALSYKDLNELEAEFVQASLDFKRKAEQERVEARQRELELESAQLLAAEQEKRAEVEARAARKFRMASSALGICFLLALIATGVAIAEQQKAADAQRVAEGIALKLEESLRDTENAKGKAEAESARAELSKKDALEHAKRAKLSEENAKAAQRGAEVERERAVMQARIADAAKAEADEQRAEADKQKRTASRLLIGTDILLGQTHLVINNIPDALSAFARAFDTASKDREGINDDDDDAKLRFMFARAAKKLEGQEFSVGGDEEAGGQVRKANFSPDGKYIITTSDNDIVNVWDASNGKLFRKFRIRRQVVRSAALSPNNKYLVVAGDDGNASIWDVESEKKLHPLEDHSDKVYYAIFSPNNKRVVTASFDGTAKIWDVEEGVLIHTLEGHGGAVYYATFSPDSSRVFTVSIDKTVKVWNAKSGEMLASLKGHKEFISTAAISPDGKRVLTASDDMTAKIWDVEEGELIHTLGEHVGKVYYAAFSPDGKLIVTASEDKTAKVWDAESGERLVSLEGHKQHVHDASFNSDGSLVVTGSDDRTAKVWDTETGDLLASFEGHNDILIAAMFNPNSKFGNLVMTASSDKTAKVWDWAKITTPIKLLEGHSDKVEHGAFSTNSKLAVTASSDRTARIWDISTGRTLWRLTGHTDALHYASFSPDNRLVVTASEDGTAKIWDVETGKLLHTLEGHGGAVHYATFSPDSSRVFTVSIDKDKTVRVWDARGGEMLASFKNPEGVTSTAAISLDGKRVLTASDDMTAKIWDVASGKVYKTKVVGDVDYAAFSPDGTRVFIICDDNDKPAKNDNDKSAKIWDVERNEMVEIEIRNSVISHAKFSPRDGRLLVTVDKAGSAKIWDAKKGANMYSLGDEVTNAEFSPDDKFIFTANKNGSASIWYATTGELLYVFEGQHTKPVSYIAFSPDRKVVVTLSGDKTAKILDVHLEDRPSEEISNDLRRRFPYLLQTRNRLLLSRPSPSLGH